MQIEHPVELCVCGTEYIDRVECARVLGSTKPV